jgi:hypothetical protein
MRRAKTRPGIAPALMLLPLLLWLGGATAPAQAQVALGRLFATPAERQAMEANRGASEAPPPGSQGLPPEGQPIPGAEGMPQPAAPAAPEALVMNGVLRSSSGRSTVWLNDVPQSGARNKLSKRGAASPALTVTLPSGKKVILKAGQRYDLNEGRVKDVNEP